MYSSILETCSKSSSREVTSFIFTKASNKCQNFKKNPKNMQASIFEADISKKTQKMTDAWAVTQVITQAVIKAAKVAVQTIPVAEAEGGTGEKAQQ